MENEESDAIERLWREYAMAFEEFDDLTLARWMAQTLGQLSGHVWRSSHPLVASYQVAAQVGLQRQIWLKRLVSIPAGYSTAPCCRSPLLPVLTRDVLKDGLMCIHCAETVTPFNELPPILQPRVRDWAMRYDAVHQVAHWDDTRRLSTPNYDDMVDMAAEEAEKLLAEARDQLLPPFLEFYPAIVWEDRDECLDVRAEDIPPAA